MEARVEKRINWVFAALQGDFDFTGNDAYAIDRTKLDWPANPEAAGRPLAPGPQVRADRRDDEQEDAGRGEEDRARPLRADAEEHRGDRGQRPGGAYYLDCIAELYDPHSTYFSADTFEDFNIQMRLKLVGIGAVLESKDDYCVVKELVPGGPADLDHRLKPSDRIIAVAQDGQPPVEIIGMKLIKIVSMIRGAKDTRVHLTVEPGNATDSSHNKDIIITRDEVKLECRPARAPPSSRGAPGPDGKNVPLGVITLRAF